MELELRLPGVPEARCVARESVDALSPDLPVQRRKDLALLVHELVANALQHASLSHRDTIELSISSVPERVRVQVTDPGAGFHPRVAPPKRFQTRGMGLFLINHIADRWGVECGPTTRVWFEIDLQPRLRAVQT